MQGKYHLLSISILLSIIYLLSFLASRTGFISSRLHSKIWNSALLISFIIAGFTGFFVAIQINYKIDIPVIDQIMIFHVDFGIALFFISVFHILLHLNYFRNFFDKPKEKKQQIKINAESGSSLNKLVTKKWKLIYSIIALGFTSMLTQIVFFREFVSVFSGNELLLGMLLSIWLILTGTGAMSCHRVINLKNIKKILLVMQILIGLFPLITLFLLLVSKNFIFQPGVQVNYMQLAVFSFFMLLPFCFVSGLLFSLLSRLLSDYYPKNAINLNYSFESLGSLTGGFIFSFAMVFFCSGFQALFIVLIINLMAIFFVLSEKYGLIFKFTFPVLLIALLIGAIVFDFDKYAKGFLFQNQEIKSINQSPYGQLIITENSGQLNFYRNGFYLFSSDSIYSSNANFATDEESVHFAMLQHPSPKNILFITDGLGGSIKEILKYQVDCIDYIEIDPVICKIAIAHNKQLSNQQVKIINSDVKEFLKHINKKYDVVFISVAPPSGTETNRFYTDDFFRLLHNKMSSFSVLTLSLPSTANYIDDISLLSNRMIFNTLANNFRQTKVFPGEKNYFIASNNSISTSIVEKISRKNIENEYVGYYLDDISIKQRSDLMTSRIKGKSDLNFDLKPMSYLLYIKQQWSIFKGSYWMLGIFLFILFLLSLREFNRIRFGMFVTGFASISSELAIIYLFQMVFGNAYYYIGMVFTIFMSGLVVGPLLSNLKLNLPPKQIFMFSIILLALLVLFMPFLIKIFINIAPNNYFLYTIFLTFTFLVAGLTGYIFKQASQLIPENMAKLAGQIYSADLFGSAFGAILVSVFIIPLFGLLWSGLPGFILCLVSAVLFIIKRW